MNRWVYRYFWKEFQKHKAHPDPVHPKNLQRCFPTLPSLPRDTIFIKEQSDNFPEWLGKRWEERNLILSWKATSTCLGSPVMRKRGKWFYKTLTNKRWCSQQVKSWLRINPFSAVTQSRNLFTFSQELKPGPHAFYASRKRGTFDGALACANSSLTCQISWSFEIQ